MSSNPSRRKTREAILASRVADFLGWRLLVGCQHCGIERDHRIDALLAEHDGLGAVRVSALLRRLRCQVCGNPPTAVVLSGRLHDVPLLGPGAFG